MKKSAERTRREFVKQAGLVSLATAAAGPLHVTASRRPSRFAYIGSAEGHVAVFAAGPGRWKQIQEIATAQPTSLVLHPGKDVLYVINEVDLFDHLPSGSVEAYSIAKDGRIALLNRQPLSLSATAPRHAAVSPDGSSLVVAVHGGGAYNVLPILNDGSLAHVSTVLKETGFGPDEVHQRAAHPQMVVFDGNGRLLSSDMGSDRLNVFRLEEGRLSVHGRSRSHAGSGPRQMELHPNGNLLFVANALDSSVVSYGYDSRNSRILEPLSRVSLNQSGSSANAPVMMALHPSGDFLYTASRLPSQGVITWRINTASGTLKRIQEEQTRNGVHALMAVPDGGLMALSKGTLIRWEIDAEGRLENPESAAAVRQPVSMTMKYA